MLKKVLVCFVILTILLVVSESARILAVLPVPVISHQKVFRVLTHELVKRGHELTIITGQPLYEKGKAPLNYTEIDISFITSGAIENVRVENMKELDPFQQLRDSFQFTSIFIDKLLKFVDIQNLITQKTTYFDLLLLEDCFKSILIFSHIFKAPVIQMSSFGGTFATFEAVGATTHPFLFPLAVRQRYYNLTVWEKISDIFLQYQLDEAYNEAELLEYEVFKQHFGKDTPTISELKNNIHMLFLNIHPIWDSNRPVPSNVIYLGGLHQTTKEDLPKDLKYSLDSSVNGAIYVSFGTNVNPALLCIEKLQNFVNVFSKLPYDIYWKWDDEGLPELSKNIKVKKWFPQSDLLMHPNIKLFITQGGLQSTDEAIAAGVPLIGIPMMWDQWFNVDKYLHFKIGLRLDLKSVTEENLRDAIYTVINEKRYKDKIINLRSLMRDQQHSPLERAVWWTEYVLRHKGALHLRPPSANITWLEYYEVKLIVFVCLFSLCIISVILILILYILHRFAKKVKTE